VPLKYTPLDPKSRGAQVYGESPAASPSVSTTVARLFALPEVSIRGAEFLFRIDHTVPMFNPLFIFLLVFVGAPLVELYLLIEVGSEIGAIPTIALSIFTAVLGGLLVRMQGFAVLFRAQSQMANKELPALELMEGALLLLVGLALMLPGFITDAAGFLLLIPPLRRWLVVRWLKSRGTLRPAPGAVREAETRGERIIEGEYRRDE